MGAMVLTPVHRYFAPVGKNYQTFRRQLATHLGRLHPRYSRLHLYSRVTLAPVDERNEDVKLVQGVLLQESSATRTRVSLGKLSSAGREGIFSVPPQLYLRMKSKL